MISYPKRCRGNTQQYAIGVFLVASLIDMVRIQLLEKLQEECPSNVGLSLMWN